MSLILAFSSPERVRFGKTKLTVSRRLVAQPAGCHHQVDARDARWKRPRGLFGAIAAATLRVSAGCNTGARHAAPGDAVSSVARRCRRAQRVEHLHGACHQPRPPAWPIAQGVRPTCQRAKASLEVYHCPPPSSCAQAPKCATSDLKPREAAARAVEEWGSFSPNIYRGAGCAGRHRGAARRPS